VDSRSKILNAAAAHDQIDAWRLAGDSVVVISGLFDPVLADHVERLQESKCPGCRLAVVVTDYDDAILPVAARQELLAALRVVDLVTADLDAVSFHPQVQFETVDRGTAARFAAYVHERMN
jgi:glycerol-3-phosphate cytidylyltransferase-like family protein